MPDNMFKKVLVTGGAGYVGAVLIPKLLAAGYAVNVLDLYLYGDDVFDGVKPNAALTEFKGDLRDLEVVQSAVDGCDCVIHLACISNDPSFELNPALGKSINLDCFEPLVKAAKDSGVKRFVYASSSSVYGVKDDPSVTEDLSLEPLTDYSKFKADCEAVLQQESSDDFVTCTIRPATVCGFSPRQRLDVIVNILTNHAVNNGRIKVFGGEQKRPNIHIEDMTDLYVQLLTEQDDKINGKIYNAGGKNHTVNELAEIVKQTVGGDLVVDVLPSDDLRSYHVCSDRLKRDIGWEPKLGIKEAVQDLMAAFERGDLTNSMEDSRYYNIRKMQEVHLA
jgi:nucleoside-diphosphate-sugar epimerase